MNTGLEPKQSDSVASAIALPMGQHASGDAQTAKRRAHIHSLDRSIFGPVQLDPATASRYACLADKKERHAFGNQLLDAVPMTTLARIEWFKKRFEFRDQGFGVGSVRAF